MAVTFSDLHTEGGLKALEAFLAGKSYISGDKFTKDDVRVYAAVHGVPGDSFPNVCKWYNSVSSKLASSFPGKAAGVGVGGAAASAKELKAAPAAAAGDDDDDDLDLFGDETEEDKKAAEEREKAKSSTKKKESGKSSVLLDVKPWDDETDMKKLEEAVRSIEMPGLFWGACTFCIIQIYVVNMVFFYSYALSEVVILCMMSSLQQNWLLLVTESRSSRS
ncbi:unnamed protein product [Linum tenue]|uniref:Translation elongation factor EF1B beta/delta subunit guanine nucleotide exchange domain-containing protein n=1 Tax=Linum tenue TaxID=586396 RepID=A0AAV0QWR8_9ROSI|nr:unnamed protein product [Linum tenue]